MHGGKGNGCSVFVMCEYQVNYHARSDHKWYVDEVYLVDNGHHLVFACFMLKRQLSTAVHTKCENILRSCANLE